MSIGSSGGAIPARNVPLSNADIANAVPVVAERLERHLSTTLANIERINEQAKAECASIEAERQRKKEAADKKIEEGLEDIEAGMKQMAAADHKKEVAERKMEAAERKMTSAQSKMEAVRIGRQQILAKEFGKIFRKTLTSPAEINSVYTTYLADGSLTVEQNSLGKSYSKINSLEAIKKYLHAHRDVPACDFRHFGTTLEDIIPALADFLKDCTTVKAVAFNPGISATAKEKLAEAVAARATKRVPLAVKYS